MDISRPAGSNMGDPVKKEPAKQGLSELEIIKQERDALRSASGNLRCSFLPET